MWQEICTWAGQDEGLRRGGVSRDVGRCRRRTQRDRGQDRGQHRKVHSWAGQGRAGQGRAGQDRTGQGRAGQGRAGKVTARQDSETEIVTRPCEDKVWAAQVRSPKYIGELGYQRRKHIITGVRLTLVRTSAGNRHTSATSVGDRPPRALPSA